MKTNFILAICNLLLLSACSGPSEDEKNAIREACQGMTIEEVKKIDDISEDCKAAISSLLPSPSNNLGNRLFNLGSDGKGGRPRLILSGTDGDGSALSFANMQDLELSLVIAGIEQEIPKSSYSVSRALDSASDLVSISLVGDYSGSMASEDIAQVSELFGDFTQHLTPIANFEVIYFSSEVVLQQSLSSDPELLNQALQENTGIPRSSTALYDAMGKGAEDLADSTRPGHVLIVGTDGMENDSSRYSKESLKAALAADEKLMVVIMGTFLSDVDEMQDLAGERGIFVYAKDVLAGKEAILSFSKSLRESVVVELSDLYKDASEVKVKLGEATVNFNL